LEFTGEYRDGNAASAGEPQGLKPMVYSGSSARPFIPQGALKQCPDAERFYTGF